MATTHNTQERSGFPGTRAPYRLAAQALATSKGTDIGLDNDAASRQRRIR